MSLGESIQLHNKQKGIEIGEVAPQWTLRGLDGQLVGPFRYFGQPLLIFFFRGTWCPSCRQQMERIKADWNLIGSLVSVVGIMRENGEAINEFLKNNPMPFPLIPDPEAKVIQLHNVYQRFGLNGFRIAYPTTLLIDQNHIVRFCYVGHSQFDRPNLNEIIEELHKLNQPGSTHLRLS